MVAVSDLGGSGGGERLFSQLHEYFGADPRADVTFVTATSSLPSLQAAGCLLRLDRVVALPLGPSPGRGWAGVIAMTLRLLGVTLRHRFDLVHVCLPSPIYVPYLAALRLLPAARRPRSVVTVIDCTLAGSLEQPPPAGTYERQVLDAHRMYARWAGLAGIYSWYDAFVTVSARAAATAAPLVRAARYCFTDPDRFKPAPVKQPLVVFAGRLSEQKRPILFVEAVAKLRADAPHLVAGWRFEMYGRGVLLDEVTRRIAELGVGDLVTLAHTIDMAPVFARSRLFVSTQAFENFTSLAMLEAMAAGNAVIAEDVGQTREFVQDGQNGFLVRPARPETFAAAIARYLQHPDRHDAMAAASRALTTDVHTIDHFADDIHAFWQDVLGA